VKHIFLPLSEAKRHVTGTDSEAAKATVDLERDYLDKETAKKHYCGF
jgi:hypothetical protein